MKVTDDNNREQKHLTKQDIIDFFDNQKCKTCVFNKECNKNLITYDSLSICNLFGLI